MAVVLETGPDGAHHRWQRTHIRLPFEPQGREDGAASSQSTPAGDGKVAFQRPLIRRARGADELDGGGFQLLWSGIVIAVKNGSLRGSRTSGVIGNLNGHCHVCELPP